MTHPERFFAPPVTPESLHLQDERRRKWDDKERSTERALAEYHAYWTKRIRDMQSEGHSALSIAARIGVTESWVQRYFDPHMNLPDRKERADFNAHFTKVMFGVRTRTPDGAWGHVVAVDVRDQFGLGDDVWLIQTDDGEVVSAVATYCYTPE